MTIKKKGIIKKEKRVKDMDLRELFDSLPSNVHFIMELNPNAYEDKLFFMFAKGKTLSINDIRHHIFQTYENKVNQNISAICVISMSLRREVLSPYLTNLPSRGVGFHIFNWLKEINCPVFEANGSEDALRILQEF